MTLTTIILGVFVIAIGCLSLWRLSDARAEMAERIRLHAFQPQAPALFDPAMVLDLPAPARRYFTYTIAPGTPLYTVVDLRMTGRFNLGPKEAPSYLNMTARQTLAPPHGFLWKMRARGGVMRIAGSDSGEWTRFWLMGLVPVARAGGSDDHRRSAFGRLVGEAMLWTPAALLPGPGITWNAVDDDTARVTISMGDHVQEVDVTVHETGRPISVAFQRWNNANSDKTYRLQPFGGTLSCFRTFDGFTVPTHVEAGNHYGTDAYSPFFVVDVMEAQFP